MVLIYYEYLFLYILLCSLKYYEVGDGGGAGVGCVMEVGDGGGVCDGGGDGG